MIADYSWKTPNGTCEIITYVLQISPHSLLILVKHGFVQKMVSLQTGAFPTKDGKLKLDGARRYHHGQPYIAGISHYIPKFIVSFVIPKFINNYIIGSQMTKVPLVQSHTALVVGWSISNSTMVVSIIPSSYPNVNYPKLAIRRGPPTV